MGGTVRFFKGHGTGNDFVILPDPDGVLALTPSTVAALCDRRFGIGADGVLRVVRSAKHPHATDLAGEAEWFMDYWNADGSIAEMCGNGVRVFARFLASESYVDDASFPIATRSGIVNATVTPSEVTVDFAIPRVGAASTATLGGLTFTGTSVDVGNPHLVCTLPTGMALADLDLTAAPVYDKTLFPTGVNVEFIVPGDSEAAVFGHIAVDRRPAPDFGHIAVDSPPPDQRQQGHIAVDSPPPDGPVTPPPAQPARGHIAVDSPPTDERQQGHIAVDSPPPDGPVTPPPALPARGHIAVDKRPAPTGVDAHVAMRVYERGSGETLSCGSGAIAVAAVALHDAGKQTGVVAVDLRGGRLTIELTDQACIMTGPAVLVATGETLTDL
ncbi:diaminopimelate epimerase [Asanoa sp. WMMD1127]|uniref:diaminopimelate epimerase n=1 Tax=Asanoa sp. WMMD1127 TaxID=3016107 RepID=UPI0024178F44|nr:diaminopimelate epimerase [Asanoa sp. WMMD1127]MDG4823735.1 diaminopimelate epimerase [Asanoa sp. WMMD1127]